jgi:hypothetical protein
MAHTALSWFFDNLKNHEIQAEHFELYQQAKAMEKEQIEEAHEGGIERCCLEVDDFGARLVKPIVGIAGQDYYYFKYDTNEL